MIEAVLDWQITGMLDGGQDITIYKLTKYGIWMHWSSVNIFSHNN